MMDVYAKLNDPWALSVFIVTLLLPIGVGLWAMLKTKNQSDFFIGGRIMNKFVVALSAVSSGRSSWLVLGVSGMAYTMGSAAVWAIVGYITVEAFQFVYLGKRLRDETQAMDAITLLDYFDARFADQKQYIRITGAVIIALFMTAYVAAQFNAGAKTLATALDFSIELSLVISALLILVYMVLGGYVAVAWNDVVRAIIMLIGLVVLPVVGLITIGGTGTLTDLLYNLNPALIDPLSLSAGAIIGFIGVGLGSPGQPHIVVRYMSNYQSANLTWSAVIGTVWNIILGLGAICIGLVGKALYPKAAALPEGDPEMIYLVLSSDFFGTLFYGLLVGGIFAAILSTADSQLLVVAATFARDVYEKVLHKKRWLENADTLTLSRLVVIVCGIAAIGLAYIAEDLVFWLVLFAWGGLGASFGPAVILSLYWKGTTRAGIIGGMAGGTIITIIWKLWLKESSGLYELIPAFFISILLIIIISLSGKRKPL